MLSPQYLISNAIYGAIRKYAVGSAIDVDDAWLTPAVSHRLAQAVISDLNCSGWTLAAPGDEKVEPS